MWNDGFRGFCVTATWGFFLSMTGKRLTVLILAALLLHPLMAAQPSVPFEVAKTLKVTRGKPIRNGLLFVDGKFISPPYVVERYGNALRINGIQVTGQLIAWSEFLRTQDGAVVTTEMVQPAAGEATSAIEKTPEVEPEQAPVETPQPVTEISDWDDPLADLFADEKSAAKDKKKPARPPRPKPAKPVVVQPTTVTKVSFDGKFVMNDRAKALVESLNRSRAKFDAYLREGGFICVGTSYSQMSGSTAATKLILERLPELQRDHAERGDFISVARTNGLAFLSEPILSDLFINRLDYVKLIKLRNLRFEREKVEALFK